MTELTLTGLKELLREAAGEEEGVDLDGDILDTPFHDLGYDSLALLEAASRIERLLDVALDEDVVAEAETPRRLIELVNEAVRALPLAS